MKILKIILMIILLTTIVNAVEFKKIYKGEIKNSGEITADDKNCSIYDEDECSIYASGWTYDSDYNVIEEGYLGKLTNWLDTYKDFSSFDNAMIFSNAGFTLLHMYAPFLA